MRSKRSPKGSARALPATCERPGVFVFAIVAVVTIAMLGNARVALAGAHVARPGLVAPRFIVERPDGTDLTSRSLAGRPLLINVFASWCGNCRVEQPLLAAAYAKYRDRVTFLGIDEQEGVARASGYARALHVPYPIALDAGQFAATYETSKIPETILIDGHGIVRAVNRGRISAAVLEHELSSLVARKGST